MSGFGVHELLIVLLLLLVILVPQVISVVVYHRALCALPPHRRLMTPRSTYLLLIPFFGTVWEFYVVLRLSRSFAEFFSAAGQPPDGNCGRAIGLAFCVCNACALIPVVGVFAGVAGFVLWLGYLLSVREMRDRVIRIGDAGAPTST